MPIGPASSYAASKRSIPGRWGAFGQKAYATLTTALSGTNNDLKFTSVNRGTASNSIRIRYVVSGNNTALAVAVANKDITVTVATDGGGAATSTAEDVMDAVNGHAGASALVTAALASGNDGSGVVAALAYTALAGGTEWVIGTSR